MCPQQLPYGKRMPLLAEFQGFPDGRLVEFQILKKKDGREEEVTKLYAATYYDKARTLWWPGYREHEAKLTEHDFPEPSKETYFFKAKIDERGSEQVVDGDEFEFLGALILNFNQKIGDRETPLDNVEYTITFSDGNDRTGKFSDGVAEFKDVPVGKFKIEVDSYKPRTLYGIIEPVGLTKAKATLTAEISFNIKLFIDEEMLSPDSTSSIEKLDTRSGQHEKIEFTKDLLAINDELRLFFEDNVTSGDPDNTRPRKSRSEFYEEYAKDLLDLLIPLRVEVRKFKGQSREPVPIDDDKVEVAFEVADPREDTNVIQGPSAGTRAISPSKTGKDFVEKFIQATRLKAGSDDNCIREYATSLFQSRCRESGLKVNAYDILYQYTGLIFRSLKPLEPFPSGAKVSVDGKKDKAGKPMGTAIVVLRPPPVPGDNYIIKVTMWPSAPLKDSDGRKCNEFRTPTMTVWKRVKIHMVVHQEGVSYDAIKWDEVKRAYGDAFIDVAATDDIGKHSHTVGISKDEWKKYLEEYIYGPGNPYVRNWNKSTWSTYKSDPNCSTDLDSYCFPQSTDLIPPDQAPPDSDSYPTSWSLLTLLTKRIIEDKLDKEDVNWGDFKDPSKEKRVGLCLLFCKPPSSRSVVYGAHIGGKAFFMVTKGDITDTFVHEMGHALFLRHGATTDVIRATWRPSFLAPDVIPYLANQALTDASIVLRSEEAGSSGPFLDDHDSEDMISCVMSYGCDCYDSGGNKFTDTDHGNAHIAKADHPSDWHFCGSCLLNLRFYDLDRMVKSKTDSYRKVQYWQKPQIAIKIGAETTYKRAHAQTNYVPITRLDFPPPKQTLSLKANDSKYLYALYPEEGIFDNRGRNPRKDLCYLTQSRINNGLGRGRWISSDPTVAIVELKVENEKLVSILKPQKKGTTKITFEIVQGPGKVVASDPLEVEVQE